MNMMAGAGAMLGGASAMMAGSNFSPKSKIFATFMFIGYTVMLYLVSIMIYLLVGMFVFHETSNLDFLFPHSMVVIPIFPAGIYLVLFLKLIWSVPKKKQRKNYLN